MKMHGNEAAQAFRDGCSLPESLRCSLPSEPVAWRRTALVLVQRALAMRDYARPNRPSPQATVLSNGSLRVGDTIFQFTDFGGEVAEECPVVRLYRTPDEVPRTQTEACVSHHDLATFVGQIVMLRACGVRARIEQWLKGAEAAPSAKP